MDATGRSAQSAATEALGERLGQLAQPDQVIALVGDLGAGKTTLVRGLGRGLELEAAISSPTYTLMHTYPGRLELYHFDAWMEGREAAFLDGGGREWFEAGGVAVVEWAERVSQALPADVLWLRLGHTSAPRFDADGHPDPEQARSVALEARGARSAALLEALLAGLASAPVPGLTLEKE